jgi:putative endonuclease
LNRIAKPDRRQELGRSGEDLAVESLRRDGFRVVDRRWRSCGAEIDIVCERGELVVFVEVKARSGDGFGAPSEAVTRTKRRRIARAAMSYLVRHGWLDRACRFDVVEVRADPDGTHRVNHIEDAFRLEPGDYPGA